MTYDYVFQVVPGRGWTVKSFSTCGIHIWQSYAICIPLSDEMVMWGERGTLILNSTEIARNVPPWETSFRENISRKTENRTDNPTRITKH